MNAGDLRLVGVQMSYDGRAYRRTPALLFFGLAFPIVFLLIFATLFRDDRLDRLGGVQYTKYYVPQVVALAVMGVCLTNLAIVVCYRRESGELKRLRGTPLPAWVFVASLIGTCLLASAALSVVTILTGRVLYHVTFPGRYAALVLTLFVGAICFCALAIALAALIPNVDVAPAVANGVFFPLTFISGTFTVVPDRSVLAKIATVFPVRHFNLAVFATFDPRRSDSGLEWGHLVVIAAWGVAGLIAAVRWFRWQPRRR